MQSFTFPDPVLDARELKLIDELARKYENFSATGPLRKRGKQLLDLGKSVIPSGVREGVGQVAKKASEWHLPREALMKAVSGFGQLNSVAAAHTLSSERIVRTLQDEKCQLDEFAQICGLRSYMIQKVVHGMKWKSQSYALLEGVATGAFGFVGIPFNLGASLFLYFRAVQEVALYYGYDVKGDEAELQFAATTTMLSLAPSMSSQEVGGLPVIISHMMLATDLTVLQQTLKGTFAQMIEEGGLSLLYVQTRALANKAAKKALDKAGQKGMEVGIFGGMLKQVGRRLPKSVGGRAIPIFGAFVGGLIDFGLMQQVLRGSDLIYHKRFLMEKEDRVCLLRETGNWF